MPYEKARLVGDDTIYRELWDALHALRSVLDEVQQGLDAERKDDTDDDAGPR